MVTKKLAGKVALLPSASARPTERWRNYSLPSVLMPSSPVAANPDRRGPNHSFLSSPTAG